MAVRSSAKPGASKPRAKRVRKELAPLSMDKIQVAKVDRSDMAKFRPARGERNADQRMFDEVVQSAWDAWVDAGRPSHTDWLENVENATYLRVPEDQWDTVQTYVRRAGAHYNFKIRFGQLEKADGFVETVFIATDRPEKDEADESGEDDE